MRPIGGWRVGCALAGVLSWGLAVQAAPGGAQKADVKIKRVPATAIVSMDGKDTFAAYCASCHGRDARGTGPAAPALKGPVPDLTLIAKRSGKFDPLAVAAKLNGQEPLVAAHGGAPDMPIWGPVFTAMQGDKDTVAQLRVRNLVNYLGSIQAK